MRGLAMVLALALSGCAGEGSDDPRADDILALTGDAATGATLFGDNCTTCHGDDGSGVSAPNIQGAAAETVVSKMLTGPGSMPDFSDWPDQDIADVVAHVESL